jgi:anti-sigma factor RsiW
MRADRGAMACAEVRSLLPELAEGAPHEAGPVEAHLVGCPACSEELARYRAVIGAMAGLRDVLEEPSPGFLEQVLATVPRPGGLRAIRRVARVAANRRVALSVGGAVVGATAVGFLWWRSARRGALTAAGPVVGA